MKTMIDKLRRGSLIAAVALAAGAAHADAGSGKLTVAGYTDAGAGMMLAAHDYEGVIDKLAGHTPAFSADPVAASTNLCVAYIAMDRLGDARMACDEAVQRAKDDYAGYTLADRKSHDAAVALAEANRATLAKLGE